MSVAVSGISKKRLEAVYIFDTQRLEKIKINKGDLKEAVELCTQRFLNKPISGYTVQGVISQHFGNKNYDEDKIASIVDRTLRYYIHYRQGGSNVIIVNGDPSILN